MPKRTHQKSKRKRAKKLGFRLKNNDKKGKKVLKRRRLKGRKNLVWNMLAKVYSLKGEKKINEVLKKGKREQSDNFGVFYFDRKNDDHPKFAFVISKKISKLAVHRNRVKRAMSESVRRNINVVPKGLEFVFLAKKSIVRKTTEEIMKEVFNFLKEFKSWCRR